MTDTGTITTEIDAVQAFLAALEAKDTDAALALLAPDATYQNVPFPPARGRAAIEKQLRWLERGIERFEVRYDHVASNGPVVLTERTDILTVGSVDIGFWVCGTFEVHDGQITLWRDRFDFLDVAWGVVKGAGRAIAARLRRG